MTQKTGLIWNERFMWHDNGSALGQIPAGGAFQPGVHLENPETKRRLKNLLDAYDVTPQLSRLAHTAATRQTLERFHTPDYIDLVAHTSQTTGGSVGQSTIAGPGSYDIARLAVGGTTAAIKDVMAGAVSNAYALTRPPGHHAERDRGRGFCIFNNIALAILEARAQGWVDRVAVVDWDVHHGNGTQDIFYDNEKVLYISTHQYPYYPGSGTNDEKGKHNNILNIPLPAGTTSEEYLNAYELVLKKIKEFRPEFILLSAGFDAHKDDPLAQLQLESKDFYNITKRTLELSKQYCDGKVVSILEGGYDLLALQESTEMHVKALLEFN